MPAFWKRATTTVASGGVTAIVPSLPPKGTLRHVTVGSGQTEGTGQAPAHVAMFYGDSATSSFLRLKEGWTRGFSDLIGGDMLTWEGEQTIDTGVGNPTLNVRVRNDSGATLVVSVSWSYET